MASGENAISSSKSLVSIQKRSASLSGVIIQWGDNIDQHPVSVGIDVTASVDIQSREYNGNWYTDVKAWRVEHGSGEQNSAGNSSTLSTESFEIDTQAFDDIDDELPF